MNDEIESSFCNESDSFDSEITHASAAVMKQNEKFEIQRLRQINQQLEESLESMKKQLKSALDSSSAAKSTAESVNFLKQQLQESNEKRESLNVKIIEMQSKQDENEQKYKNEAKLLQDENKKLCESLEKRKKDINSLKETISQNEQLMELMTDNIQKNKQQKKKQKQKMKALLAKNDELFIENQSKDDQIQQLQMELQKQKEQYSELMEQKQKAESIIAEKDQKIECLIKETTIHKSTYAELEGQLEAQEHELRTLSTERKRVIDIVGVLQAALSKSYEIINTMKNEKKESDIVKKQIPKPDAINNADVLDIKLPFEGDVLDEMEKIIKSPQYTAIQKVQLIINKAAKSIEETEEEINKLKKEQLENIKVQEESHDDKYYSILNAALSKFASIITNKEASTIFDKEVVDFVGREFMEINEKLKDSREPEAEFIPKDFFTSIDSRKRINIIKDISLSNPELYSIILYQVLLNKSIIQRNEEQQNKKDEDARIVQREIPEQNETITKLNETIQTLEDEKKKLRSMMKATKAQLLSVNQSDNEHQTEIAKLKLEVNGLKNDLEVANMKLEIYANEATQRQNDISNISTLAAQTREETANAYNSQQNQQLKSQLDKKINEYNELKKINDSLQATIANLTKQNKKQQKKLNESFEKEKEALLAEIESLQQKISKLTKSYNKKLRIAEEQFSSEYANINTKLEEANDKLVKAQSDYETIANEYNTIKQKSDSIQSELTQKLKVIEKERNEQSNAQKELKVELTNTKQQLQKEKQRSMCQLSAQTMAYETKIQQIQQEIKDKTNKAVEEIYSIVSDNFGQYYGVDSCDFNDDTFKQIVMLIKNDLEKLKLFQTAQTDYNNDQL